MLYLYMEREGRIKIDLLIKKLNLENITLFSIYSLSILIPLIIGKPQLLVGSAVNFLITYSTLKFGIKKIIPILILPSITAYLTGLLLGSTTIFLLYLIPFISFSNFLYSLFIRKKKYISYLSAIVLKGVFLLLSYYLLNRLISLPKVFLASSCLQFVTATIGLITGVLFYKVTE